MKNPVYWVNFAIILLGLGLTQLATAAPEQPEKSADRNFIGDLNAEQITLKVINSESFGNLLVSSPTRVINGGKVWDYSDLDKNKLVPGVVCIAFCGQPENVVEEISNGRITFKGESVAEETNLTNTAEVAILFENDSFVISCKRNPRSLERATLKEFNEAFSGIAEIYLNTTSK